MPVLETKGALSAQGYGITTSIPQNYIEDFFSTWLYTGNGTARTIENGINLRNLNEVKFITPGTYSWVCPSGVNNVSVVCVGGGGGGAGWNDSTSPFPTPAGGGGGGLGYKNNISVTPGQTYTVVVGSGGTLGATSSNGIAGQDSYFINTSTVRGGGGGGGVFGGAGGSGGTFTGDGGGNGGPGGVGAASGNAVGGGGGGAGGYSGTGGTGGRGDLGGSLSAPGTAGSGGGAGGGSSGLSTPGSFRVGGGGGGGVGLLGQGTSGAATSTPTTVNLTTFGGKGGSGGGTAPDVTTPDTGFLPGGAPGLYGGGGAGGLPGASSPPGASGAVRIVWNSGVMFPSTNTGEVANANGGLVWMKNRSGSTDHALYDTARGATFDLASNLTSAQTTQSTGLTGFLDNGFSIGSLAKINVNNGAYVSWTFREQPKFFDIVTWTGNGANRTIAHSLGSVPGCIMVKRTDASADWQVYHRSLANTQYAVLNSTAAAATGATRWNSATPTATEFSLGTDATVNANGGTYVAYLFAHNAGGFGATGADNVISCGSYTGNGSTQNINLGYEPQWILLKRSDGSNNWIILDVMRGFTSDGNFQIHPNNSAAETGPLVSGGIFPNATGFTVGGLFSQGSEGWIYIAIRRGPMRTPTSGTSVFNPVVYTGTNIDNRLVNTTIAPDMVWVRQRNDTALNGMVVGDRLRAQPYLLTGSSAAEVNDADAFDAQNVAGNEYGTAFSSMNGFWCGNDTTAKLNFNTAPNNHVAEAFRRAPGFFDVVCYTGNGGSNTQSHNLGVVPELIIAKPRSVSGDWMVTSSYWGVTANFLRLNSNTARTFLGGFSDNTVITSTQIGVSGSTTNASGTTYVAYLFATCPGVSQVGTFTGTGATQTINCGFSSGARFVLIKRTDASGDWYVWDSARGIVAGNDPYLLLNSTAAEVTNTDWVDTAASGFELSNAAGNLVNTNGGSYIFLSIA